MPQGSAVQVVLGAMSGLRSAYKLRWYLWTTMGTFIYTSSSDREASSHTWLLNTCNTFSATEDGDL